MEPPDDALQYRRTDNTRQSRWSLNHAHQSTTGVPTGLAGEKGCRVSFAREGPIAGVLFRSSQWEMTAGAAAVGMLARMFWVLAVAEVRQVKIGP